MPPRSVHLIRHAEGFHNLSVENHTLRDPLLTSNGEQQCLELSKKIPNADQVQCIVSSPLRRALYTALLVFRTLLEEKPHIRIIALPEIQETTCLGADVGLSRLELEAEFKGEPVDFSLVADDWNDKHSGRFAPHTQLIVNRAQRARQFLNSRKEDVVAVITHGTFLHFFTEDWEGSMMGDGTGWVNCELRTYHFDGESQDKSAYAALVEERAASVRRRSTSRKLSSCSHSKLRSETQQLWKRLGYIV